MRRHSFVVAKPPSHCAADHHQDRRPAARWDPCDYTCHSGRQGGPSACACDTCSPSNAAAAPTAPELPRLVAPPVAPLAAAVQCVTIELCRRGR
jgi:hypothetical protein